jgi:regulator of sigma E protease
MSLPGAFSVAAVVLGVSFLIFFHELGHFVFARLAKVRVEIFSLGFGPRLFGRRRGATDYRVSLLPLGGYVKLAGESPSSGATGAPDELASKSVGARALIFSGGVLFNVLFAILLFPLLFRVGVPFLRPVVGSVVPGGPAWKVGFEEGMTVLEVGDREIIAFEQISSEIAISGPGPVRVRVREADGDERVLEPEPVFDPENGFRVIQIGPPADPERRIDVDRGGPAWEAGLRDGDRILAVDGDSEDVLERFEAAMADGSPLQLLVDGEEDPRSVTVTPRFETEGESFRIGIVPVANRVKGARGLAERAGIEAGDRVFRAGSREVLEPADLEASLAEARGTLPLTVLRGEKTLVIEAPAGEEEARRWMRDLAFEADEESTRILPLAGHPAEREGVRRGDLVFAANERRIDRYRELVEEIRRAGANPVTLDLRREGGEEFRIEVRPEPRPRADYGFGVRYADYTYRTDDLLHACVVGWRSSLEMVREFLGAIRRIVSKEMSAKTLSGIVSIVRFSYRFSEIAFTKFLFFLGILSLNLGLINVLPIPVLDGGHLLFLAIEKVKGSPVSERMLVLSQVVGLAVIGVLILFVTWNDIRRWWPDFLPF